MDIKERARKAIEGIDETRPQLIRDLLAALEEKETELAVLYKNYEKMDNKTDQTIWNLREAVEKETAIRCAMIADDNGWSRAADAIRTEYGLTD